MPKPLLRKTPLTLFFLLAAASSIGQVYNSVTLFPGAGIQWSNHYNGQMSITLPYTTTDASGVTTSHVLTSQPHKVYYPVRVDVATLGYERGGLKRVFSFAASFPLEHGVSTWGARITTGYGFNMYFDKKDDEAMEDSRFIFQATVHLVYSWDRGGNNDAILGVLENTDQTIHVLGKDAGPEFTVKGTRYSAGGTYASKNCVLRYAQRELAVMPKITLSQNPFRYNAHFQLSIGYTIPLIDRGGIFIDQDDGGSHRSAGLGHPLNITNSDLTVLVDGKATKKTPLDFGGPYLSLALAIGGNWKQVRFYRGR